MSTDDSNDPDWKEQLHQVVATSQNFVYTRRLIQGELSGGQIVWFAISFFPMIPIDTIRVGAKVIFLVRFGVQAKLKELKPPEQEE